jgi:hypothetical protein
MHIVEGGAGTAQMDRVGAMPNYVVWLNCLGDAHCGRCALPRSKVRAAKIIVAAAPSCP